MIFKTKCMDQREDMALTGQDSYYMHQGQPDSVAGLQNAPNNMSQLSSSALHFFESNTEGSLSVPALHLDSSSAMPGGHGVGVGGPPTMNQEEPVRRKRGRPRKYGHDGAVSLGLSPFVSNAGTIMRPTQKWRGRPPSAGRKHQLSSTGGSMFNTTGSMTPHIINVAVGEDIKRKVLSLLQGRRAIVVLSGIGSVAAANIKVSSSSRSVTYEGHFDIVNLSGSFINDVEGPHGPTGGLNVMFAGPDGCLIGGPVEGVLIAASPVQVIAGSIVASTSKTKNKVLEDEEESGDPDRAYGNSITPASNMQASQNLSPMGVWSSSR